MRFKSMDWNNGWRQLGERIQPVFRQIGQDVSPDLTVHLAEDMYVHIAQHARRKVNPPNDTWMAFSPNKRGYKKHPHFQVGLLDDHLFIWLAYIYELPNKSQYATKLLEQQQLLHALPSDFVISYDHRKRTHSRLMRRRSSKVLSASGM